MRRFLPLVLLGAVLPAAAAIVFRAPAGSPYATGENPLALASADFNGDGRADLAVANFYSNSVSVMLADSAGAMTTASVPVVAHPQAIAAGNANGDGSADFVVMNNEPQIANQNGIPDLAMVLLGNGVGGFTSAGQYNVGPDPAAVALGDLNGDGRAELVVTNTRFLTDTYQQELIVIPGLGDGSFDDANRVLFVTREAIYPCRITPGASCTIATPRSIRIADVNGDGSPDLVTAQPGTKEVGVWLGNGSFGFAAAAGSPIAFPRFVQAVATGDFNADGAVDLAVAHATFYSVSILLGDGDGGFAIAAGSPVDTSGAAYAVATGDFNGDGNLDVAASGNQDTAGAVNVLIGNGVGGLAALAGTPVAVNGVPNDIAVADFDDDGLADLASVSNQTATVTVLLAFDQDITPDSFTLNDRTNVAANAKYASNIVTIGGLNTAAPVQVSNGDYSKNGGAYTTAEGSVVNGDTLRVRIVSASTPNTTAVATLTVGDSSESFQVTTGGPDGTPGAFAFTDQTLVDPLTVRFSNKITVTGINVAAPISITGAGGTYRINSGAFTAGPGSVYVGDKVTVRHVSAAAANTAVDTVLTIGGVSDTFTSTTNSKDIIPDAFGFPTVTGAPRSTLVESAVVTPGGFDSPSPVKAAAGTEYRLNGGAYTTAAGTINPGDSLQVRHVTAASFDTVRATSVRIGNVNGVFRTRTVAE